MFKAEAAKRPAARLPFAEAVRNQPRQILIGIGLVVTVPTVSYMGVSYLPNYGTTVLGLDRTSVLVAGIVGGFLYPVGTLIGGLLADRWGRRRTLLAATVLAVVWTPLMFPVATIGSIGAFTACLCITIFIGGLALGPVGAVLSEIFQTQYRYPAAGFSYNAAQIIGGAIPPLVAAPIIASAGTFVFSLFLVALCLISLVSIIKLRESADEDLADVSAGEP